MSQPRMPDQASQFVPDLAEALRRYWGYHEFRPKQENVIRSLLAAHDTCVVMPSAAGKSLCYQLPAVISGKTAVCGEPVPVFGSGGGQAVADALTRVTGAPVPL